NLASMSVDNICSQPFPGFFGFKPSPLEAVVPGYLAPTTSRARYARFRHDAGRSRMKTYLVGGSVRDELLGLPVQDRDYVVVGADPEEILKSGFRPVGADFPVFLHPET